MPSEGLHEAFLLPRLCDNGHSRQTPRGPMASLMYHPRLASQVVPDLSVARGPTLLS